MTTILRLQNRVLRVTQPFNLELPREAVVSIDDAANVRIACVQGSVWITLDNDLRDIVLGDCGVFASVENRRALVYAMKPSRISISIAASFAPNALKHKRPRPLILQMQTA